MNSPVPASPTESVTAEDIRFLRTTAAALEDEVMARYEDFLYYENQHVNETKWKSLGSEGSVHFYQERRTHWTKSTASPPSPLTVPDLEPQATLAGQSMVGRMLVTGTIEGNLDDALLGCSFQDTASLKAHTTYHRGRRDDCAVLLKIDGPTKHDPYRFLGVTWHVLNPLLARTRDGVLLQHIHLTTLRTGERVGVSLRHSIQHQKVGKIRGFSATRAKVSSVSFYRDVGENRLEVFGVEFLDIQRPMHRNELTQYLVLSTRVCAMGFKKKLCWLMHQPRSDPQTSSKNQQQCAVCTKSTKRLFSSSGTRCCLCQKWMCAQCTEHFELMVVVSSPDIVTKKVGFCVECVVLAKQVSSLQVAESAWKSHK